MGSKTVSKPLGSGVLLHHSFRLLIVCPGKCILGVDCADSLVHPLCSSSQLGHWTLPTFQKVPRSLAAKVRDSIINLESIRDRWFGLSYLLLQGLKLVVVLMNDFTLLFWTLRNRD